MPAVRLSAEAKRRRIEAVGYWWHSIDLGDGVVTPGIKWGGGVEAMMDDVRRIGLPEDITGRTVLDIGAYDGFYSFEAERRGASQVLALDHFVWLNDIAGGRVDYGLQYLPAGKPDAGAATPGKRPFDTAHELLSSRVVSVVGDFMHYPLDELGRFDLVLFLGIVYHMEDPLRAMRRLYQVTDDLAIIESEIAEFGGFEDHPMVEFLPGAELNQDPTNWWIPNVPALIGLAHAAGFRRVELVGRHPPTPTPGALLERGRATIHAWR